MMASARVSRRVRRALSRRRLGVIGGQRDWGRRVWGRARTASRASDGARVPGSAPVSKEARNRDPRGAGWQRCHRASAARSISAKYAQLVLRGEGPAARAVPQSGDAAAGAETIVGLRPSSVSAPAAAKVSADIVRGMTMSMFHLTPSRVNFRGVDVSSSLARRVGRDAGKAHNHRPGHPDAAGRRRPTAARWSARLILPCGGSQHLGRGLSHQGMGFAAVARVTEDRRLRAECMTTSPSARSPGGELKVKSTICREYTKAGIWS